MPKLLLIQPSQYSVTGAIVKQKKIYLPGLVFPLLAALAPRHWKVEVKLEVIEDIDFDTDADLVGIGAMGHALFRGLELAAKFREKGKIVFMGGSMASMIPDFALSVADSIVIGDGEISFLELLSDFEKSGKLAERYDNPVKNLNGLPVPDYKVLLDKSIGDMLPVQAGRGCPHSCTFCSIACIYKGRYLARPVDEVINDIKAIRDYGFRKFYLIDDNIVSNPGYLEELCRRIHPLKMRWSTQCTMNLARNKPLLKKVAASGCEILSLGIESITQEGLDRLNKKWLRVDEHEELLNEFRKAGIMVSAEMIIGTDSDTEESLKATIDFIMRSRIPLLRVYILTPVPGTQLYDDLKSSGRLLHENFEKYTAAECVHRPERISPEMLTSMYKWMNSKIFSYPGILRRTLMNPELFRYPVRYLFAFGVNLHYRSYVVQGDTPLIV
jgi:radical SAM superfamily enzyme YgiQ (UPF0313 family)